MTWGGPDQAFLDPSISCYPVQNSPLRLAILFCELGECLNLKYVLTADPLYLYAELNQNSSGKVILHLDADTTCANLCLEVEKDKLLHRVNNQFLLGTHGRHVVELLLVLTDHGDQPYLVQYLSNFAKQSAKFHCWTPFG